MARAVAAAALCTLILAACGVAVEPTAAPAEQPAWNHDPDSTTGPTRWGAIDEAFEACAEGTSQSPVDIAATVPTELPPLEFDYSGTPLVVENTGHVIEVPMPEEGDQTLTIGDEVYRLVQYHFHAPSEHTLDGESFDVEAHLVHQGEAGRLAVVGVFLDQGEPASALLDAVMANAPAEAGAEAEVEVDVEWSPLGLVPVDGSSTQVSAYSTYPGSLTTPGCTEGVRWIVLDDRLGVSSAATDRLHELIAAFPGYDGHEDNNRPTQPLNDREVERSAE
jgi:carbonic anhydrase